MSTRKIAKLTKWQIHGIEAELQRKQPGRFDRESTFGGTVVALNYSHSR